MCTGRRAIKINSLLGTSGIFWDLQNLVKLFTVAVNCLAQMLEVKAELIKRLCSYNVFAAEQIFIARFERDLNKDFKLMLTHIYFPCISVCPHILSLHSKCFNDYFNRAVTPLNKSQPFSFSAVSTSYNLP